MDNDQRSNRFELVLLSVLDEYGDEIESVLGLLADSRHWCDRNDLSFAELDRRAYARYLDQLHEPTDERNRHDH